MSTSKPELRCRTCNTIYHYRKTPNSWVRSILFFLPVKSFFCARCLKTRYLLISDKEYKKYTEVLWLLAVAITF